MLLAQGIPLVQVSQFHQQHRRLQTVEAAIVPD